MFVQKLSLDNFKSHAGTTLEMERITVIRGANHVGKSSVSNALEYLLAGRCPSTSADGKGAAGLVRELATQATITAVINDAPMQCTIDRKGSRTGAKAWEDRDVLSCLTNTAYLYTMSPAAQKDLLSGLVLPKHHAFDAWVGEALQELKLRQTFGDDLNATIASIYDVAFAERTALKRARQATSIPAGDTSKAKDTSENVAKLQGLRAQLTDLKARQQSAGKDLTAHQERVYREDKALNDANAKLSRERQEADAIKPRILSDKGLADAGRNAARAKEVQDLSAELAAVTERVDQAGKLVERLQAVAIGDCPTCNQALTEDILAQVVSAALAKKADANAEARELRKKLQALGDPVSAVLAIKSHDEAVTALKRAEERIAEAEKELKAAKVAIQNRPDAPVAGEDLMPQINEIQSRISKGEGVVAEIQAANNLKQRQEEARQHLESVERKVALAERLVEEFGPKGIKAQLLSENIDAFQQDMNAALTVWDYTCELRFEPFSFGIVTPEAGHRELSLLSESEMHRFAVAFQVALAQWSGHKFVVVDRADVLDQASRKALNLMLMRSNLDQAIIIGTNESMDAKPTKGIGIYAFTMAEDQTTRVERLA